MAKIQIAITSDAQALAAKISERFGKELNKEKYDKIVVTKVQLKNDDIVFHWDTALSKAPQADQDDRA